MTIQGSSEGYTPISAQPKKISGPHIRRLGKMGPNALQGTANLIALKAQEQRATANNAMANRPPTGPTYNAAPMTVSKPHQKIPPPPTNAAHMTVSKAPQKAPPAPPRAQTKVDNARLAKAEAEAAAELDKLGELDTPKPNRGIPEHMRAPPKQPPSAAQKAKDKAMIARNLKHFQHLQQTSSSSNQYTANVKPGSVREQVVYGQLPPNGQTSTVQYGKIDNVKAPQTNVQAKIEMQNKLRANITSAERANALAGPIINNSNGFNGMKLTR